MTVDTPTDEATEVVTPEVVGAEHVAPPGEPETPEKCPECGTDTVDLTDFAGEIIDRWCPQCHPEGAPDGPGLFGDPSAVGAVVPVDRGAVQARELAASLPGIPARDEFMALASMARALSMSSVVPKALRGKPADVLVVLLTGRDLGVPITSALRRIYVIEGQPTIAPKLLNARLRQLGLGSCLPKTSTTGLAVAVALDVGGGIDRRCKGLMLDDHWVGYSDGSEGTTQMQRPEGASIVERCACQGILGEVEFSWADAVRADAVRADCRPEEHCPECRTWRGDRDHKDGVRMRCKANYRSYPQRMLWARAQGWCIDDHWPQASLGLYDPDSLGAVTDADGNYIDAASAPLPDGFDAVQGRGGARSGGDPAAGPTLEDPLPEDESLDLRRQVIALGADGKRSFFVAYRNAQLPVWEELTVGQGRTVTALLPPIVRDARKAGVPYDEDLARLRAGDAADEESPPPPVTDGTAEAPTTDEGRPEATDGEVPTSDAPAEQAPLL